MPTKKKMTSQKLLDILTSKGGIKPDSTLAELAMSTDRDVTDMEDLGYCIKDIVQNGYTCVVYPAGDRIMLSVHG